jgi:hypothetical protein
MRRESGLRNERADGAIHVGRFGDRRREHWSGRLQRGVKADFPFRPGLREARRDPLLRDQYGWRHPNTATSAPAEVTLPYIVRLAGKGVDALRDDAGFGESLNTYRGFIACRPVAEALNRMNRYRDFAGL